MLWLVLGGLTLFLFLGGLRAFERASVTTVKSLLIWIAALGGLSLALLLVLTGRERHRPGCADPVRAPHLEPLARRTSLAARAPAAQHGARPRRRAAKRRGHAAGR